MPTPAQIPERHLHLVYAAALRQTRDPHLAADITQAVFVLLARRIQQGRPPKETHMAGWLLNVTRFAVKESRRAATRRAYHEKQASALRESQSTNAPEDSLLPLLDDALLALPATDRELLIRRYLQSQPVSELAATLRIPPNTAAKRITRALDRLRTLLHHRGILAPAALLTATLATQSLIRTPPALAGQILSAPAAITPLAKSLLARLAVLKLQTAALLCAALLIASLSLFAIHRYISSQPPTDTHIIAANAPTNAPTPAPTDPQTEQVLSRIYQLRYSVITTVTTEETYAAIRDLVSIGKPAVPELCTELDRATSDSELRALAFTLRAINDPRAVPALIHALPKTPVLVSDYGSALQSRDLWQFVVQHRLPSSAAAPEYPEFDIPRANREITAALESMTHHSVGKASLGGAKDDRPDSIAIAQTHRAADADRWQKWWDVHWTELLSQAELDSLNLPTTGDPVDSAGVAAFGPLFPAGHRIHLGPAREITLPGAPLFDQHAFINFNTGHTFTLLQDIADPATTDITFVPWFHQLNIDAQSVQLIRSTSPIHGPPQYVYQLQSTFTRTWCIDDNRWDSLEAELRTENAIDPGDSGPHGNFMRYRRDIGLPDFDNQYPITFLFITADNTRGILQLLGTSQNPGGVHFRYRLFEGISPNTTPVQTPPSPTHTCNLLFAPEKTITLAAPASKDPSALDLETSQTRTPDTDLTKPDDRTNLTAQTDIWLASCHADLIVAPASPDDPHLYALRCCGMALFPCTSAAFQTLSAADVASIVRRRPAPTTPQFIYANFEQQSPATWAFKTRSGATGLLQITASTPATLTLHYKLLK